MECIIINEIIVSVRTCTWLFLMAVFHTGIERYVRVLYTTRFLSTLIKIMINNDF